MDIIYHRLFQNDLSVAIRYYDQEGGKKLGDRFFDAVEATVAKIELNPTRYHFISEDYRRAPVANFPYHVVFQTSPSRLKFLILRHDRRHPSFGLRRRLR